MFSETPSIPLIKRTHVKGDAPSSAIYSPCERYRYALTRTWDNTAPRITYVMLNPSKATEAQNDPTIERCERRARALGFGAMRITNLFGWRETDPAKMRKAADPVGPDNDLILARAAAWADVVLAAWGVHGVLKNRCDVAEQILMASGTPIMALGTTKQGHPRHPLYVAYAQQPTVWPGRAKATTS